jgi:hypothetical protein
MGTLQTTHEGSRNIIRSPRVRDPPENKSKMTNKPTAERILKAFSAIALTLIKTAAGEVMLRRLTPLSGLQEDILQQLGLGAALYGQLAIQGIGT